MEELSADRSIQEFEDWLAARSIQEFEDAGIPFDAYHEDSQKSLIAAYKRFYPDFDESTLMSRFK